MSTSTEQAIDSSEHRHVMVLIESLSREGSSEREIEAAVRDVTGEPGPAPTRPRRRFRLLTWGRNESLEPQIDRA